MSSQTTVRLIRLRVTPRKFTTARRDIFNAWFVSKRPSQTQLS